MVKALTFKMQCWRLYHMKEWLKKRNKIRHCFRIRKNSKEQKMHSDEAAIF